MSDKIIDLIKSSAITQGIITIVVVTLDAVLIYQGRPVPDMWVGLTALVVGFYFGSKVGVLQGKSGQPAPQ